MSGAPFASPDFNFFQKNLKKLLTYHVNRGIIYTQGNQPKNIEPARAGRKGERNEKSYNCRGLGQGSTV